MLMDEKIKERITQIQCGIVPEGYIKGKGGIFPSDWVSKKMRQWLTLKERPIILEDSQTYQLVTVRRAFGGVHSRGQYEGKDVLVKKYFKVCQGDFIISKRQIAHGACGIVPQKLAGAVVSNEYNVFVPHTGTNIEMFNFKMQLPYYKRLFYLMSDGVHIEKLLFKTNDWMRRSLAMPSLPEQQKITRILLTCDKVIGLKEKCIYEKKRKKKYLMQELLTGRKRVDGSKHKWKQRRILDIAKITTGATPSTNIEKYWGGDIKWMSSGELNLKKVYDVEGRISAEGYSCSGTKLLPAGCVLIGLAGQGKTRGTVAINYTELCTNQSIAAIWPNEIIDSEYLYHNLDMRYNELRKISSGDGSRGGLNLQLIGHLKVSYPDKQEQQTISNIISTMDREIELLQRDLEQEKLKKKALMQLLLTGIVRVNT